jgi:hypothetical protein
VLRRVTTLKARSCTRRPFRYKVSGSFDSLSKVLFNFPSRYLFAIGLTPLFSLGWNIPPTSDCTLKQPYSTVPPIDPNVKASYRTVTFCSPVFQLSSPTKTLVLDGLIPHISLQRLVYRDSGWALPLSLAATNGISVDFFSSR